jgi:hypothetical protein
MLKLRCFRTSMTLLPAVLGLATTLSFAGRPAVVPAPPDLDRQAALTESPAWQDFVARNGEWTVQWNEDNGTPKRAMSHAYPLVTPPLDERMVVDAIRSFVDDNRNVFQLGSSDLRLLYAVPTHNHWIALFQQQRSGLVVEESQLTFWVTHEGKLAVFEERGIFPRFDVPTSIAVGGLDARDILLAATLPDGGPLGSTVTFDEPVLSIAPDESNTTAHLAWKVGILVDQPEHHFVGFVDASTGEIVRSSDEIYYVDVVGHVDGNARQESGCSTLVNYNLKDILVQIQGGNSAYTDANGNFTIPNSGSAPVTVNVRCSGRWANVRNAAGSDLLVSTTLTPGVTGNIHMDPGTPGELTFAQVDGFLQTTIISDYVRRVTGTALSSFQELVNVNINSTCNAYYNGSSINFFHAGGGCTNTAYSSVVHHEYGHDIDARAGGITDGGLSEGFGDMNSMYALGDPIIGLGFFSGSCGGIRNGNNNRQWPATECGGEVHCTGEVFMGFTWLVRQNLINSLGSTNGIAAAEHDAYACLLSNPPSIPDAVNAFFVADDNDGDLSNGVPHLNELSAAARAHNFSVPQPPTLTSVSPTTLGRCPGVIVTIRGTNFVPGATQVRLNGVPATVSAVDASSLNFTDPGGGTNGPVTLSVSTPFGSVSSGSLLSRNGTFALSQLGTANIGETFQMVVCGEANARYFLVASLEMNGGSFDGISLPIGPRLYRIRDSYLGADPPLGSSGTITINIPVPSRNTLALRHGLFQGYIAAQLNPALTNIADVQFFYRN